MGSPGEQKPIVRDMYRDEANPNAEDAVYIEARRQKLRAEKQDSSDLVVYADKDSFD